MNIISKGLKTIAVKRKNVELQMIHSNNIDILKLFCASDCLKQSNTRRTNPCFCFSDCKMLNANVKCYNTNMCNCNNRCEVLKQSIKIKLDKPV